MPLAPRFGFLSLSFGENASCACCAACRPDPGDHCGPFGQEGGQAGPAPPDARRTSKSAPPFKITNHDHYIGSLYGFWDCHHPLEHESDAGIGWRYESPLTYMPPLTGGRMLLWSGLVIRLAASVRPASRWQADPALSERQRVRTDSGVQRFSRSGMARRQDGG